MCCFSGRVNSVSGTRIFARRKNPKEQFLVYSMALKTPQDVAMILPIPTPSNSAEDAVKFINLEKYKRFFNDMSRGWPIPPSGNLSRNREPADNAAKKLVVVDVGSFEASFVPKIADFERLDPRFRLPSATWNKLPAYSDSGFAVFKLKKGNSRVHPMAFSFPTRDSERLFFPTVHIHDGMVHNRARFDHILYCQRESSVFLSLQGWRESKGLAMQFMDVGKSTGIVDGNEHCYRRMLRGTLKNQDTWV